jgi:hypothetical protein
VSFGAPEPGLCGSCHHVRVVESRRGSRFFMCDLSRSDPRFPRYPRLPVLRCRGFVAVHEAPEPGPGADD